MKVLNKLTSQVYTIIKPTCSELRPFSTLSWSILRWFSFSTRIPSLKSSPVVDSSQWTTAYDKPKRFEATWQALSQIHQLEPVPIVPIEVRAPAFPRHCFLSELYSARQPQGSRVLQVPDQ